MYVNSHLCYIKPFFMLLRASYLAHFKYLPIIRNIVFYTVIKTRMLQDSKSIISKQDHSQSQYFVYFLIVIRVCNENTWKIHISTAPAESLQNLDASWHVKNLTYQYNILTWKYLITYLSGILNIFQFDVVLLEILDIHTLQQNSLFVFSYL